MLLLAWLGQLTLRRAETALPLTARQRVWGTVVFAIWLGAIGLVVWSYVAERATQRQQPEPSVESDVLMREWRE
ncbi:MAG TPA: hypothetical protein VKU02_23700 [Gemmataceae bacterium]|nr:hypothetical protein [Gemmataceae bacterium]